jgi:hypothetical protein
LGLGVWGLGIGPPPNPQSPIPNPQSPLKIYLFKEFNNKHNFNSLNVFIVNYLYFY